MKANAVIHMTGTLPSLYNYVQITVIGSHTDYYMSF